MLVELKCSLTTPFVDDLEFPNLWETSNIDSLNWTLLFFLQDIIKRFHFHLECLINDLIVQKKRTNQRFFPHFDKFD